MTVLARQTALGLACLLCVLAPASSRAQTGGGSPASTVVVADPDVEALKSAYEYGRFQDVLDRARARIDRGNLPREHLVTLHKLAGLAAFNLNLPQDADRHFTALLKLDPDFSLDPFTVSPPTIAAFEKIRKELEPQLELIRQQQRMEAERIRRDAEDRARRQREDEERRRRVEELSRRVTVRNVEKRSFLVNFVPFGAGQFQQDRTAAGVVIAVTEGALALTSIISYFAYDALLEEQTVIIDTVEGPRTYTQVGIPKDRVNEANVWRIVKYASAGAFYTVYAYGVVDAIYHHEDEQVTTTMLQLPPEPEPTLPRRIPESPKPPDAPTQEEPKKDTVPLGPGVTGQSSRDTPDPSGGAPSAQREIAPEAPPPGDSRANEISLTPASTRELPVDARYFLYPTPGGMGAGLSLKF